MNGTIAQPIVATQRTSGGRFLRLAVLVVLPAAAVTSGLLVYRHFTHPDFLRRAAETYLQRHVTGTARIGSASFSWSEGIRLENVAIHEAGEASGSPVCTCSQVGLKPDLGQLLRGRLSVESLVAEAPSCAVVRDRAGTTNLGALFHPPSGEDLPPGVGLPMAELRNARLKVIDRTGPEDRMVEDITLQVRGRAHPTRSGSYDVVWRREEPASAVGYSRIDVATGRLTNVFGGLPWMSLEAVMIAIDARHEEGSHWGDLLGLRGDVRASDYQFGGSEDAEHTVTVELEDTALSIPIDGYERQLPDEERYLRFERVFGSVKLSRTSAEARFEGLFNGSRVRAKAVFRGDMEELRSLDDVGFNVELALTNAELPNLDARQSEAQARFLDEFPPIGDFFCSYDPHGKVDLELVASKEAGRESPVVVEHLVLTARGGDVSFRWFPYRVHDVTGRVVLTPEGVQVTGMRGTHGGGRIELDAWLREPNRCSEAQLSVRGYGLPIDQELCAALPSRFRSICDTFSLAGTISADVDLIRPRCAGSKPEDWRGTTTVRLEDVSGRYAKLPYPVTGIRGTAVLHNDFVRLESLRGAAGTGRVAIDGGVSVAKGKNAPVDLQVSAIDVSFDEALYAALPEGMAESLRRFHPAGRFDLTATVYRQPDSGGLGYSADVKLADAKVTHEAWPGEVTELAGVLRLTPGELELRDMTGRLGPARLTASGRLEQGPTSGAADVRIRIAGAELDDSWMERLPAGVQERLAGWSLRGRADIEAHLLREAASAGHLLRSGRVDLRDAVVRHPRLPRALEEVEGSIRWEDDVLAISDVTARWGRSSLRMGMSVYEADDATEARVELHAANLSLDQQLKQLLPESVAKLLKQLDPSGEADVHLEELVVRQESSGERKTSSVRGRVDLNDASLRGFSALSGLNGELRFDGMLMDGQGGSAFSGTFDLYEALAYQQPVRNLRGSWKLARSGEEQAALIVEAFEGSLHGGQVSGDAQVAVDGEARFELTAMARRVDVEPLLKGMRPAGSDPDKPVSARGKLDGRLHLSGVLGDSHALRGGGEVQIINGHLYRLPVMLAILHVINLTVPDEDVFEDASARFFVLGRRILFEDIQLRGTALALRGSGTMSLPDRGLNLNLINVSPNRWARVPALADFVEGATGELVELQVTGPVSQPSVQARPLPGLRDEFRELFRKKEPARITPSGS